MKRVVLLCLLAYLVSFSCKKNDADSGQYNNHDGYTPMSVGNYWVYGSYLIDSVGNAVFNHYVDSIVVTKDTMINNKKYFLFVHFSFYDTIPRYYFFDEVRIYRDSSGTLIWYTSPSCNKVKADKDYIYMSSVNFTTPIYNFNSYCDSVDLHMRRMIQMQKVNEQVTVPAGNFNGILNQEQALTGILDYAGITFPSIKNYFVKKVGLILTSNFYASGWINDKKTQELRLLRYHINPK
jgi:hypothetical protein